MIKAWWNRLLHQDKASILLFVGTFAVFLVTANRSLTFYANDVIFVAEPAWTLATKGTLDISGFNSVENIINWTFPYDGGLRSDRFPGAILWSALFYGVSQPAAFTMFPAALSAALSCSIAVVALHRVLLKLVRPRVALGSAVLMAFGTSVWTVSADAIWTEGPVIMALALSMLALSSERYVLAGAAYAFGILTRPHVAVFAAVSGIWEGARKRSVVPVLKVGLVSALGLIGLLIYNKVNSGQWDIFPGSYGGRVSGAVAAEPGYGQARGSEWLGDYAATFFSPLRGLFVYSPFLLLVLPGLVRAWRVAPAWVRSSAVGAVVYLVVQLAGNTWFGGGYFFGYRLIIPSLMGWWPLLTIAYQQWTDNAAWRRYTFAALGAFSIWTMAQGSLALDVAYITTMPDRLFDWWEWTGTLMLGWSGPFGWAAGLVFVGLVGFLVSLVPDEEPAAPPVKKGKAKQAVPGKATKGESGSDEEPVAIAAKGKSKASPAGEQDGKPQTQGAKKKPAPNANKKRR